MRFAEPRSSLLRNQENPPGDKSGPNGETRDRNPAPAVRPDLLM